MTTECVGLMGRLFGHKFRGRYSEVAEPPEQIDSFKGSAAGMAMALDKLTRKERTYVRDVCERCGQVTP